MLALFLALSLGQVPSKVTVAVGESKVVRVPCLQRIAISGADGYEVRNRGCRELEFIGLAPTKATVLAWTAKGERVAVAIEVVPAATPPVQVTRTVEKVGVDGRERAVEVFTFPEELVEVTSARETDGGVLLEGRTAKGERLEVFVSPRP